MTWIKLEEIFIFRVGFFTTTLRLFLFQWTDQVVQLDGTLRCTSISNRVSPVRIPVTTTWLWPGICRCPLTWQCFAPLNPTGPGWTYLVFSVAYLLSFVVSMNVKASATESSIKLQTHSSSTWRSKAVSNPSKSSCVVSKDPVIFTRLAHTIPYLQ